MRLGPRGDDLEEFPVEFFEPGRRLLVGLPEQAEQGIERAAIGTLNDLDSNVDSCRTAPEFLQNRDRSGRSEEHTSELQSRENLVCRLLLEKKKKIKNTKNTKYSKMN